MKVKYNILDSIPYPLIIHKLNEDGKQISWNYKWYFQAEADFIRHARIYQIPFQDIADYTRNALGTVKLKARYGLYNDFGRIKEDVNKRDGYRCRICKIGKKLHTHHILHSHIHTLKNLVTLCPKCHSKMEKLRTQGIIPKEIIN